MKKIIYLFSLAALMLMPLTSIAQTSNRNEMRENVKIQTNQEIKDLSDMLQISEDQLGKITQLLNSYNMTRAELASFEMKPEDTKRRVDILNNSHISQMDKILTPEQMEIYLKYFTKKNEK